MSLNANTITWTLTDALFETGYNAALAEIEALPPEEVSPVNIEIMAAVTTASGVLPELVAMRPQIVEELPKFDIGSFDKLHTYVLAAGYAHAQHLISAQPSGELKGLNEEAIQLRDTLEVDANALAKRGLLNPEALRSLRGPNGYKNVATDLQMLVQLLKTNWPVIQGKCAVAESDLDRGATLASRIIHLVGFKEQGPGGVARAADLRARAFTLFSRTYNDARRAVIYLRWHEGDADTIAPSLYAGRSNGRTGVKKPTEPTTETKTPTGTQTNAPGPVPPAPAAPTGPSTSNGGPFVS